ncbi:MAG: hypothetical protein KDK97_03995, partial [Verrucomicrobiales bacterium]|nr:hypothetical protein [Verrucomicrobiales bacterium]
SLIRNVGPKMKPSVHDNHLYAYAVDGRAGLIVLRTEYAYGEEPFEQTDVIFEGVLDHYFRNPVLPSIIFDVEEADVARTIARDKAVIDQGHKIGGWPSFWQDSIEGMMVTIADAGCKMFEISSSYGLDGWVVAKSCEFRPGAKKNCQQGIASDHDKPPL